MKLKIELPYTGMELLALAQQKLAEEANERAAEDAEIKALMGPPLALLPDPEMWIGDETPAAASVTEIMELADDVLNRDEFQQDDSGTHWDGKQWLTPNKWRLHKTQCTVKCEYCQGITSEGGAVRWLPKHLSPSGRGLTMHTTCWQRAQTEEG